MIAGFLDHQQYHRDSSFQPCRSSRHVQCVLDCQESSGPHLECSSTAPKCEYCFCWLILVYTPIDFNPLLLRKSDSNPHFFTRSLSNKGMMVSQQTASHLEQQLTVFIHCAPKLGSDTRGSRKTNEWTCKIPSILSRCISEQRNICDFPSFQGEGG